jgi:phospholipase/carboxylesterase
MQLPIEWLPAQGDPEQLIVLLHGWGEDGRAMAPLAQALRAQFPQAAVLAPDAPGEAGAGKGGRQWYGIRQLDPVTWPARVEAALAVLEPWVRAQQQRLRVAPAATALGGFSQGAILALELATRQDGIAGRVLAFGGRYMAPPPLAPRHATIHLFHGSADKVIPDSGSREALQTLAELQGDATLDIADGIGHELHPVLIDCALHRLKTHIPLRTWQAALGAARATATPAQDD